jgi:hypothetical protein
MGARFRTNLESRPRSGRDAHCPSIGVLGPGTAHREIVSSARGNPPTAKELCLSL